MGKIKDAMIDQMNEQAQIGPLQWTADSTTAQPVLVSPTSPLLCDGNYMTASGDIFGFEAMPVDEIIGLLKSGEILHLNIEVYYE